MQSLWNLGRMGGGRSVGAATDMQRAAGGRGPGAGGNPYGAMAAMQSQWQSQLAALVQQQQQAQQAEQARRQAEYDRQVANAREAQRRAFEANQKQDAEIRQNLNNTRQGVMAGLANLGNTRRRDIRDTYSRQRADTDQSMIDRGLFNTTVRDSALAGVTADEQRANSDLEEQVGRMRSDYMLRLGQNEVNYLNSVNNQYPDLAGLGSAAAGAALGGFPSTGGGGGGMPVASPAPLNGSQAPPRQFDPGTGWGGPGGGLPVAAPAPLPGGGGEKTSTAWSYGPGMNAGGTAVLPAYV